MNTFSSREVIERLRIAFSVQTDSDLAKCLGISKSALSNWKTRNSLDLELIDTKCEHLSLEWVFRGRGPMYYSEISIISEAVTYAIPMPNSVPYYEVDFVGGYDDIVNEQSIQPACYISVPGFERADYWCCVRGNSMSPQICNGDIIALRECTIENIKYGEVYAVVMDELRTIKKIRRSFSDENLRFIPINPDYDEQEYHKSRIIRVFEVLGCITKFF